MIPMESFAMGTWTATYLGSRPVESWESDPFCQEPFNPLKERDATRNRSTQLRSWRFSTEGFRNSPGHCSRRSLDCVTEVVGMQASKRDEGKASDC